MITGVAKGFGQFTAFGKDSSGNPKRFSSDKSAPQRKYIKDSSRNSFNEDYSNMVGRGLLKS